MHTWFLFIETADDQSCLALSLDELKNIKHPLERYTFANLVNLQKNSRTVVVISAIHCTIHKVELPWLGERKSRETIPYALEENLAEPINQLHFGFNRAYFFKNYYLVVVINRAFLQALIDKLQLHELNFQCITLDWFALHENEACLMDEHLLVYDKNTLGGLDKELQNIYFNDNSAEIILYQLKEKSTSPLHSKVASSKIQTISWEWLAQRLMENPEFNLCQGEFHYLTQQKPNNYWYKIACGLIGGLFATWLIMHFIQLHILNSKINALDGKILAIYREFYPHAAPSNSDQIREILKNSQNNSNNPFWLLMNKFASSLDNQIQIQQIRFQSGVLSLELTANDFAALERLEQRLQHQQVKVTQVQAVSQPQNVLASLELRQ